jgi:hypothetical protein
VFFPVLNSLMQTKKHSVQIMSGEKRCFKRVGLHYNAISIDQR